MAAGAKDITGGSHAYTGTDGESPTESLGEGHDVGAHLLRSQPHSGAPNTRLHFVHDEQCTVLVTQLADGGEDAIGEGNHTTHHIPFVLAGNAFGQWQTGRYLDYPQGEAHNRLLIAIMNGFGIPGDVFGDPRVCEGGALRLG